jgi:putative SOS response-associated peptidase YedK
MAGIYNSTIDTATRELITSFAIVTKQANRVMEQIHNSKKRMPTILPEHLAQECITPNISQQLINEISILALTLIFIKVLSIQSYLLHYLLEFKLKIFVNLF